MLRSRWAQGWAKIVVFVLCLVPAGLLAWRFYTGDLTPNPIEFVTHFTGDWAIRLVVATLAVTPLRKLLRMPDLIRFRRMLGLFAFFYATLHFATWFGLDKFFDMHEILDDFTKRRFIIAGLVGYVCMIPLAITSTKGWIRRLGGRRWQLLHRLIYVTGIAVVVHYYWLVKSDIRLPLLYGSLVAVLLAYRGLVQWFGAGRRPRPLDMLPIDHVTVAGADLCRMRKSLAGVGIETIYGGPHRDGVTEMALVSFPDGSYLELIAPQSQVEPQSLECHPWAGFLTGEAGPSAWAVCTDDLEAELLRLRTAGVSVSSPVANGRQRPDGVRLEWETATCGASAPGSFFPFLIRDITARDLRAFPDGAPGSREYRGIARVVLGVRNLSAAIARFRQAYGPSVAFKVTDPAFGAHIAVPADAPIILAQPVDADSWLAARLERFGEAPCGVVLDAAGAGQSAEHTQSRWIDLSIGWFDTEALGWRLGFIRRTTDT